jgi:hypothetical protein
MRRSPNGWLQHGVDLAPGGRRRPVNSLLRLGRQVICQRALCCRRQGRARGRAPVAVCPNGMDAREPELREVDVAQDRVVLFNGRRGHLGGQIINSREEGA